MTEVRAERLFGFEKVAGGDAPDAILERRDVEIDEETERAMFEFQVGEELSVVDREQFSDGFEFEDQFALDDKVEAVATIEFYAFVSNGISRWRSNARPAWVNS